MCDLLIEGAGSVVIYSCQIIVEHNLLSANHVYLVAESALINDGDGVGSIIPRAGVTCGDSIFLGAHSAILPVARLSFVAGSSIP